MYPPLMLVREYNSARVDTSIFLWYKDKSQQQENMNIAWVGIYTNLPKLPLVFVASVTTLHIMILQCIVEKLLGTLPHLRGSAYTLGRHDLWGHSEPQV